MFMRTTPLLLSIACTIGAILAPAPLASAANFAPPASKPAAPASEPDSGAKPNEPLSLSPEAFRKAIIDRANDIFSQMPEQRRIFESRAQARMLFEYALEWCDFKTDRDAFVAAVAAMRLTETLARAEQTSKEPVDKATVAALARSIPLCRAIGLAIDREDDPARVIGVLTRLVEANPKAVGDPDLATLVAAICLVHDEPVTRMPQNAQQLSAWANDRAWKPEVVDPADVLDYYVRNRAKLNNPLSGMPVEALVYVVDSPCTPAELEWAVETYKGHSAVGSLYHTIVYDTQHFKMSRPKKITKTDGYTLQNIRKVGGVCVEQGFFAANVAKALGVPATTVTVRGSETGHCYVGYLQSRGAGTKWNFDEGCDDEYQSIRGYISQPQSRRTIHNGDVAMSGLVMIAKPLDREFASAMAQTSDHLISRDVSFSRALENAKPVPGIAPPPNRQPRRVDSEQALAMLRVALHDCPFHSAGWNQVCDWAEKGLMTRDGYKSWGEAVMKFAGNRNPDFAFDIMGRLFDSIESREEAAEHWDWAASRFQTRSDLATAARLREARAWRDTAQPQRAWAIYESIARTCRNEGQVIVESLKEAESLLQDEGRPTSASIPLYEQALRRTPKPGKMSPEFTAGSAWVRLISRLITHYTSVGNTKDAAGLQKDLNRTLDRD